MCAIWSARRTRAGSDRYPVPVTCCVETTSKTEWWFVVDPENGLKELKIPNYPEEEPKKLSDDPDAEQE